MNMMTTNHSRFAQVVRSHGCKNDSMEVSSVDRFEMSTVCER
jgi:hypothetical protein